jgi:hypothetical protein
MLMAPTPEIDLASRSPFFTGVFKPVFNQVPPHDMLGFLNVEGKAVVIETFPPSFLYDLSELRIPSILHNRTLIWEGEPPLFGSPKPDGGIDLSQPLINTPPTLDLVKSWDRAKSAAVTRWLEETGSPHRRPQIPRCPFRKIG